MPPAEPDVIAYDADMTPIYQWSNCGHVTTLDELPRDGLAGMAIPIAHLIRRRDGWVLKGEDDTLQQLSDEIVLPDPNERKPRELKRVELIPPPEELEEHEPLTEQQMTEVALFAALHRGFREDEDPGSIIITDHDILRAITHGTISVEKRENGEVVYRAHDGRLSHFRVGQVEAIEDPYQQGIRHALGVLEKAFEGSTRLPAAYRSATDMLNELLNRDKET